MFALYWCKLLYLCKDNENGRTFCTFQQTTTRTKLDFRRYIYKIDWNSRLIGLLGARGVGKTTLVLQHIKENLNPNEALYVTAEDFYLPNINY